MGVVLIQFASLEMNIDFVDAEEIAATHICQSARKTVSIRPLSTVGVVVCGGGRIYTW